MNKDDAIDLAQNILDQIRDSTEYLLSRERINKLHTLDAADRTIVDQSTVLVDSVEAMRPVALRAWVVESQVSHCLFGYTHADTLCAGLYRCERSNRRRCGVRQLSPEDGGLDGSRRQSFERPGRSQA